MLPAGALLNLLGTGVGLIGRLAQPSNTAVEGATFADLLDRVSEGTLRAGEPVKIDPASGVELTADQLDRIKQAAARLESAGAARAVILVDDLALEFDVLTQTVTGAADMTGGEAVAGIDAVVRAPGGEEADGVVTKPPSVALSNTALLEMLARRGGFNDAA